MFVLSDAQTRRCLALLVTFHILVIAASNYLVQLPFTLLGFHTTWGAFSFPFIFLATDLTVRLFGKEPARAIVLLDTGLEAPGQDVADAWVSAAWNIQTSPE